ncbi:hypothetical protein Leryth_020108 [Lithospermum erythrorhizon]|nr:hypothetical protein Leryth_020108 [Lithospermum erythrorhizon]
MYITTQKTNPYPLQTIHSIRHIICSSTPTLLLSPSERGRKKQAEPGRFLGVRRRPWGRYAAEIRDPSTKERHWLGTFDSAQEAALAYDNAALSMKGTQARTNFIYHCDNNHQNTLIFPSLITPFDLQTIFDQPSQTNVLEINETKELEVDGFKKEMSNNVSFDHDNNLFFPCDDRNSGYLDSIVPETCLKPPGTSDQKNACNLKDNGNSSEKQVEFDGNKNVNFLDNGSTKEESLSCYGGVEDNGSWDLYAMINKSNVLIGEGACMGLMGGFYV